MSIKINVLTEHWVVRDFRGGALNGEQLEQPKAKEKFTHYVYGDAEVDGKKVDVMEYVYRLQGEEFVNTEINGIIRKYAN